MSLEKNQNEGFSISFTKRCILMSKIALNTNLILVNSFDILPIVKLYFADSNQENFIYSKIKGVICFFMENEQLNKKEEALTENKEKKEQENAVEDNKNEENKNEENKDTSNNKNSNKNETEDTKKEIKYHLQIFDINNYSLLFDLELNESMI